MMREEGEHPAATSPVALTRVPRAGELGRLVAIATAAKMLPPPRAEMQLVADSRSLCVGGRPAVGCPEEAAAGLTLPERQWGKPPGVPVGNEATLLAACPFPARRGCSRYPSLPACLPPIRACRLPLSPSSPGAGSFLPGTAWPGKEPDSSRLGPGRCRREQSHPTALHPWKKGNSSPGPPRTRLARGSWKGRSAAPAMPHFLDWFVPVYLVISILILVGFGACIYYFEPGLQEAHKWRTQRPIMERDLRKTLMIRDNLAFGVPEV